MSSPRQRRQAARRAAPSGHAIHGQRRGFTSAGIQHEAPGDGSEIDPYIVADLALTKRVAEKLEACYPAHPWMVKVSHAQGIVQIALPLVMKRNECWVLHISNLAHDPGLRAVMRAAGEILEKHNMPRHGFSLDAFLHARDAGPLGAASRVRPKLWMPELVSSAREGSGIRF